MFPCCLMALRMISQYCGQIDKTHCNLRAGPMWLKCKIDNLKLIPLNARIQRSCGSHISYIQTVLEPEDEESHELLGQQVAELISLLLLSDTDGCKEPQRDTTTSIVIRSDTEPLYDYVKVIKIEMCYFDKWVRKKPCGSCETCAAPFDEWQMVFASRRHLRSRYTTCRCSRLLISKRAVWISFGFCVACLQEMKGLKWLEVIMMGGAERGA